MVLKLFEDLVFLFF